MAPPPFGASIDTKPADDVKDNDELMRLVRDIDDGDAWVVARFDALTGGRLPAEVANQLPPINWFSARGFVNSGVEGQLRVETRDEASAKNLQDVDPWIHGARSSCSPGSIPRLPAFLDIRPALRRWKDRLPLVFTSRQR